jgi:hypothetical protein
LWLLFISKSKIGSERTPSWVNRRHPEVCNAGLKWHPTNCIPGMPETTALTLEKVCACTRDVLSMWPHCSWWINKIKLFLEPVLLLYSQTSYFIYYSCHTMCSAFKSSDRSHKFHKFLNMGSWQMFFQKSKQVISVYTMRPESA